MAAHNTLVGADVHEPKGAHTALAGQVYVADGAGSGSFQTLSLPEPPPPTVIIDDPTNLPIEDAGSILVAVGEEGWTALPIGTDGQVLTADSLEDLGVKWATPAATPDTSTISVSVAEVAHGLTDGQAVYFNGTTWELAQSNVVGTVGSHIVQVVDVDNFKAVMIGLVTGLSGLTPGDWYFVSDTTPGALTSTEPATGFSNPLGQALTATSLMVFPYRAQEIV